MSELSLQAAAKEVESISAFGRRVDRKHSTIIEAIEDGRIPATAVKVDQVTGRRVGVYWRQAMAAYVGNTDPTQAERTGAAPLPTAGGADMFEAAAPSDSAVVADPTKQTKEDPHGYLAHRARTEEFRSKQSELDYFTALGLLVPAADSREANFRRYRMLRDKLLNIPDRIATIVAAERDPSRVHQMITEEIKRVLSELSNDATAEAAGGPPERVAA